MDFLSEQSSQTTAVGATNSQRREALYSRVISVEFACLRPVTTKKERRSGGRVRRRGFLFFGSCFPFYVPYICVNKPDKKQHHRGNTATQEESSSTTDEIRRAHPTPNRPKVTLYKRFTDRRRSDLEQEELMAAANASASGGRNGRPGSGGGHRRSSSVPLASIRYVTQGRSVCAPDQPGGPTFGHAHTVFTLHAFLERWDGAQVSCYSIVARAHCFSLTFGEHMIAAAPRGF